MASQASSEDNAVESETSMNGRAIRWLASVQGAYFAVTGLWPLIHMPSFLAVTGPKTDLWLVQIVGALICIPAAVAFLIAWHGRLRVENLVAVCGSAAVLCAADIIFVTRGTISPIYLLDAGVELALLIAWAVCNRWSRKRIRVSA